MNFKNSFSIGLFFTNTHKKRYFNVKILKIPEIHKSKIPEIRKNSDIQTPLIMAMATKNTYCSFEQKQKNVFEN